MSVKSWFRSATWNIRQFIVRSAVWFKQGVTEATIGVIAVACVSIIAYSAVANVSVLTAVATWATLFEDLFGLLSVAVEIVIFGGVARMALYIQKQERVGRYGLIIFLVLLLGFSLGVARVIPGGFTVPPIL